MHASVSLSAFIAGAIVALAPLRAAEDRAETSVSPRMRSPAQRCRADDAYGDEAWRHSASVGSGADDRVRRFGFAEDVALHPPPHAPIRLRVRLFLDDCFA
jgi:hypothetical protein